MFRLSTTVLGFSKFKMNKFLAENCARRNLASSSSIEKQKVNKDKESGEKTVDESKSFVMNLFRGKAEFSQIFPYPEVLSNEQNEILKMLVGPFTKFLQDKNDPAKNDAAEEVDPATIEGLWELGAFSLQVPSDFGGLGLCNTQYARLVEIVGGNDLAVGIVLGAHQSIGFKGILLFGNPQQKNKYLPRVTSGKEMAAFCLTEPTAGSDAGSIKTKAVLSPDGKHYILNGSKIWISNGGIAEIMTVFAQTPVKDQKTGKEKNKVTSFIVERSFGGVTSGTPEKKMGIKASNTAEVYFEDCKVPVENVLGGVGNGFKVAMNILNNGRFGMAAAMSGTMRKVSQKAIEHATTRMQFGKLIDSYGTIQEKLARMAMMHYVTESIAYILSSNMDKGSVDYHLEAAISKVFASEAAWWVTDEAIQILGGNGYMKSYGVERVLRDLRIFRIFEGTNDILRLFVALTGIRYAGGHLKELQNAFSHPTAHLSLILHEVAKWGLRSVGLGPMPSLEQYVDPQLKPHAALLAKNIPLFGEVVERILMKHGRDIVNKQFLLNRLANAAIDCYTMAVVLSRATLSLTRGLSSAQHELLMAQVWCTEAAQRVTNNLHEVTSSAHNQLFDQMTTIAKNMCDYKGFVQNNPIGY